MSLVVAIGQSRLVGVHNLPKFPAPGQESVEIIHGVDPQMPFDEAICSWNIHQPAGAAIKIEAKAFGDRFETKWYTLARWSSDATIAPRESMDNQKDDDGTISTDTLSLKKNAQRIDLRLTLSNLGSAQPDLSLLAVTFTNSQAADAEDVPVASPAWSKLIDVPERSQGAYPRGGVLCSPTSVSMDLWHWSKALNRPELNKDVPEVEENVWDNVYSGAGNWPFNTAYAGSFPGLKAYVTRFSSIADLEKWIEIGVPVVCSVSFDMIRGKPLSPTESGHLVVLVGFTPTGDPIFNDPAYKDEVRRTYKRSDFEKAWRYSRRTVYLIYPETTQPPADAGSLWTP